MLASHAELTAHPIDFAHLDSQTFGDRSLQEELLGLFSEQAERIVAALEQASGDATEVRQQRADLLHTLCGSARAIGAWQVAGAAERWERACRDPEEAAGSHEATTQHLAPLRQAVEAARDAAVGLAADAHG